MVRKIYKTGWHRIENKKGRPVWKNFKPSRWRRKVFNEGLFYNRHKRIWEKEEIYLPPPPPVKDKYLINLGFDFRDSPTNTKGTHIHGYFQFTSKYPALRFYKAKLQRMVFDMLGKQRKRACHFNLSDELSETKIEPHLVLMYEDKEIWNKEPTNFKEEDYYYVE